MRTSETTHFPNSEFEQIVKFRNAWKKINSLDPKPKAMQKMLYLGMLTLIPNQVESSGALDKDRMAAVASLVRHQVALNDYLDFTQSGRNDIDHVIAIASKRKDESHQQMLKIMEKVFSPEHINLVNDSIGKLVFIEQWAAKINKHDWTLDKVATYRNVVNALNNLIVTASVLGFPDELVERLKPIEGELTFEKVRRKYEWIMGDQYSNEIERVILIMHNIAMAGQVDDDVFGEPIDRRLNISSYATVLSDTRLPRPILKAIRQKHLRQAIDLGLSRTATHGIDQLQRNAVQRPLAWLTRRREGSKITMLKEKLAQKQIWPFDLDEDASRAGLREISYIAGKI